MTLLADALVAYLGPLLAKHTAGEPIWFEDLEASRVAAAEVLKTNENTFVSKRVDDLHQTQLLAYREAATEALREWVRTMAPLPPMEDHDTQHTFVERCVSTLITSTSPWPQWRIPTAKMIVSLEMRKRARATFAKYHQEDHPAEPGKEAAVAPPAVAPPEQEQGKDDAAQVSNDEDNAEENVDENDEDGEVDEDDGEMEDDDDNDEEDDGPLEDEAGAGKAASSHVGGGGKKKNFKGQNKRKKVVARKKATNAKQTVQARKGGSVRGRRPRGGGAANSK